MFFTHIMQSLKDGAALIAFIWTAITSTLGRWLINLWVWTGYVYCMFGFGLKDLVETKPRVFEAWELVVVFFNEIALISFIFIGFFVYLFSKTSKEKSVLSYTIFLAAHFFWYAMSACLKNVSISVTLKPLASTPVSVFFNGSVWVDLVGVPIREVIAFLAFLFMGLLYLNLTNAKIYILELPFLIGLLFFTFLVSVCAANYVLLFILMEIITLSLVSTMALYFVALGPRLVKPVLKFFILNLIISAIYLLGVAFLIYNIPDLKHYITSYFSVIHQFLFFSSRFGLIFSWEPILPIIKILVLFILIPLCFKLTLAPFSVWVVNVYAHLPQFFLLLLLTFYKIVYSCIFLKIMVSTIDLIPSFQSIWPNVVFLFVWPSLFVGCLAYRTQDLGQILAFTTVSNLGYVIAGFLVATDLSLKYAIVYLVVYCAQLIGLFTVFIILHQKYKFSNLNQLFLVKHYNKNLYYVLVFIFFSLAGVPPLAGFFTKYFLFLQLYLAGFSILSIGGLLSGFIMSIIYLQIVLQLVLVKKTTYQTLYFELTKTGVANFSQSVIFRRVMKLAGAGVFIGQFVNLAFIFLVPSLGFFLDFVYNYIFLIN